MNAGAKLEHKYVCHELYTWVEIPGQWGDISPNPDFDLGDAQIKKKKKEKRRQQTHFCTNVFCNFNTPFVKW